MADYQVATHTDSKHAITKGDATWSTAHDATSGTVTSDINYMAGYTGIWRSEYTIDRGFFSVDTSAIVGTIASASLFVYFFAKANTADTFAVYEGTQAATNSATADDFNNCGTTAYNTPIAANTITTGQFTEIVLNSTAIAAINKSGYTKFCWRNSNYDVADSAPGGFPTSYDAYLYWYGAEESGKEPYLRITLEATTSTSSSTSTTSTTTSTSTTSTTTSTSSSTSTTSTTTSTSSSTSTTTTTTSTSSSTSTTTTTTSTSTSTTTTTTSTSSSTTTTTTSTSSSTSTTTTTTSTSSSTSTTTTTTSTSTSTSTTTTTTSTSSSTSTTSTTTSTSTSTSTTTTTTSTSTSTTTTTTSTSTSTSTTSTTTSTSTSTTSTTTSTSSSTSTTTTTTSTSTSTTSTTTSTSTSTTSTTTSTSTSTSTSTTSTTTSTSTTTTTTLPVTGGLAFGEENPTQGEVACSWQTWSDGAGGIPTISGDADWGKLALDLNDQGRSRVYDFGGSALRQITITENRYGTGSGTATIQYRTSDVLFLQDDVAPSWTTYTIPAVETFRYIQVRDIKT